MSTGNEEHPSGGTGVHAMASGGGSSFFDGTKFGREEAGLSGDDVGEEDDVDDVYADGGGDGGGGGGGGAGVGGGEGDVHGDLTQVGVHGSE